jgi:hypothetical protein
MVIHKFELPLRGGKQTILLPRGAKVLSAQNQHEKIMLWIKSDPTAEKVPCMFSVVATGHDIPENSRHVGTVQLRGGGFIAHLFQEGGDDAQE